MVEKSLTKLVRTIKSCKTEDQMASVQNMMESYLNGLRFEGVVDVSRVELYLKGAYNIQEMYLWGTNPLPGVLLFPEIKTEDISVLPQL